MTINAEDFANDELVAIQVFIIFENKNRKLPS